MRALTLIAAPALAALLTSCAVAPGMRELRGEGLGSTWNVTIASSQRIDEAAVRRGIQQQVDEVAHQLSRWDSTSALTLLNAADDSDWHVLPPKLHEALSYALQLASETGGAYDPTVAPLVDEWGFGTRGRRYSPPSRAAIDAVRVRVGWAKVEMDARSPRVRRPAGVQLDLSSMTHGFAADQVAAFLRTLGITSYLIDVGSELRAAGEAPEGHPWHVAIERPPSELSAAATPTPTASMTKTLARSAVAESAAAHNAAAPRARRGTSTDAPAPMHVIALRDAGIATSGNYRYFFDYDGQRYSHRIDPRTAAPITHPLASVTVIEPECMRADALATALTVLGPDKGLEFARDHDIAALFILRTERGLEERMTAKFKSYLAN